MGNLSVSGGSSSDYTATIDWGDETELTDGVIGSNGSGGFAVTGTHAYAEEGSYGVTVTVTQAGGATATLSSTALVAATAVMAADTPQTPAAAPTATLKAVRFTNSLYIHDDLDAKKVISRIWTADKFTPGTATTNAVDKNGPIGYVRGTADNLVVDISVTKPGDYENQTVQVIGIPSNNAVSIEQGTAISLIQGTATLIKASGRT